MKLADSKLTQFGVSLMLRPTLSKSPLSVVRHALKVAESVYPEYAHRFAPKKFTQPQLFAILVLRHFLHLDYRGVVQLLHEWSDIRDALSLKSVPTYSTLCRAELRLLKNTSSNSYSTSFCELLSNAL